MLVSQSTSAWIRKEHSGGRQRRRVNSLDRRRLIDASKAEKKTQLAPFFYSLALLPELLRASARGAALVQRVAGDTWSSGVEVVCVAVGRRERGESKRRERRRQQQRRRQSTEGASGGGERCGIVPLPCSLLAAVSPFCRKSDVRETRSVKRGEEPESREREAGRTSELAAA
mgnify:CR=1 FL=1